MKEYKLIFKPLSTISKLPNAQTIFGAICNIISHTQGETAFQEYIQSFNSEPWFIHSSMFPLHLLPMIHYNIFSIEYINKIMLQHKAEDELAYLQKMKTYKKIRYIHEDIYQQFIVDRQFEELQANLLNNKLAIQDGCLCKKDLQVDNQVRQLNTHVRRKDYYLEKGDNNALYYDESIYTDSLFYILVKTNKSKVDIKNIFSYTEYFGFGARHSVGKNSFKLVGIEEVGYKRNNEYKVLLSQSILDDTFVLDQSYYQIDSKKYHPSFTYINKTTHRMNLFNEGSYFKVKGSKEWVGKLLTFEINDKPLYYYAIGYII